MGSDGLKPYPLRRGQRGTMGSDGLKPYPLRRGQRGTMGSDGLKPYPLRRGQRGTTFPLLNRRHKLPVQRLAHLLPHHILFQLFLPVLHHRNIRQILRLVQQHTQLKQRIGTVEEIGPMCRTVDRPRLLNLYKQDTQRVLELVTHYRRLNA